MDEVKVGVLEAGNGMEETIGDVWSLKLEVTNFEGGDGRGASTLESSQGFVKALGIIGEDGVK